MLSRRQLLAFGAFAVMLAASRAAPCGRVDTVTLDWAYYNPVSLVLKEEGWLEEELKADGIEVRWVQSLGSNKALEFLNARQPRFRLDRRGRRAARQDQRQPDRDPSGSTPSPSGRRW